MGFISLDYGAHQKHATNQSQLNTVTFLMGVPLGRQIVPPKHGEGFTLFYVTPVK